MIRRLLTFRRFRKDIFFAFPTQGILQITRKLSTSDTLGTLDGEAIVDEFFKAAKKNDIAAVEDLVESAAFAALKDVVNITDSFGNSPLMICSQRNWSEAMAELLKNDHCDVNHQNFFGSSALMCSSSHGHLDTLRILCACKKVDIDLLSRFGQTALMKAAQAGKAESIKVLVEHGASITVRNKQGKSAIEIAQEKAHMHVVQLLNRYKLP